MCIGCHSDCRIAASHSRVNPEPFLNTSWITWVTRDWHTCVPERRRRVDSWNSLSTAGLRSYVQLVTSLYSAVKNDCNKTQSVILASSTFTKPSIVPVTEEFATKMALMMRSFFAITTVSETFSLAPMLQSRRDSIRTWKPFIMLDDGRRWSLGKKPSHVWHNLTGIWSTKRCRFIHLNESVDMKRPWKLTKTSAK